MKFIGIIPARYASTRFPGKPLADLAGKPMIQRVYEQVQNVLDAVCVATDDNRIEAAVQAFGGNVIMTSDQHKSGTDRCYEAYCKIGDGYDVVVNIQGDEPFIQPEQIEILKACFIDDSIQIATLVKPFRPDDDFETTLFNANSPKVVLNKKNEAMYFSRSIIPYMRGRKYTEWLPNHTYYKHIGLEGYLYSFRWAHKFPFGIREDRLRSLRRGVYLHGSRFTFRGYPRTSGIYASLGAYR